MRIKLLKGVYDSVVKNTGFFIECLGSVPSTHGVAHNCLVVVCKRIPSIGSYILMLRHQEETV